MLRYFLVFFCLSLAGASYAEQQTNKKRRIAILPVTSNNPRDSDAQFAGELIRTELISSGIFEVVANDQVESQLKIIEKKQRLGAGSCSSKECVIDVGNALESELIFAGKLIKSSSGSILLSGRVINVVSQKEEYSASETAESSSDLEKTCKTLVVKLNLWVTDSKFMRDMKDEEREREKAKLINKSEQSNPARPVNLGNQKTFFRIGLGTVTASGSTLSTYYGAPISLPFDIFVYHSSDPVNGRAIYLHGDMRFYSASTSSSGSVASYGSIFFISGGLSFRQVFFGSKTGGTLFQPYVTVGAKYNYMSQSTTSSTTYDVTKNSYTGIGAVAGAGIEIGLSFFGLYFEIAYGYSPMSKSKENVDGLLLNGGVAYRF